MPCVLDTSVVIDFDACGCLDELFALPLTIIAPDLLLAQEFLSTDHQRLQRLGLTVRSLNGVQLAAVIALGQQQPLVSMNGPAIWMLSS